MTREEKPTRTGGGWTSWSSFFRDFAIAAAFAVPFVVLCYFLVAFGFFLSGDHHALELF